MTVGFPFDNKPTVNSQDELALRTQGPRTYKTAPRYACFSYDDEPTVNSSRFSLMRSA